MSVIIAKRRRGKTTAAMEKAIAYRDVKVITQCENHATQWLASHSLEYKHGVTIVPPDAKEELFQDPNAFTVFESDLAATSFYKDRKDYLQTHLPRRDNCLFLFQHQRKIPLWLRSLIQ